MESQEFVVDGEGWVENPIFRTFDKVEGIFQLSVTTFPRSTKRRVPYVTWLIQSEAIEGFECATGTCPSVEQAKAMALRVAKHLQVFAP